MKRKILLLLVILMIVPTKMVMAVQAQDVAELTASVEYDEVKGKVNVTGNLSTGKGQWITIQLLQVGKNPVHFDQIYTEEGGDFTLSISIPEPRKGMYELRLGALELEQVTKVLFTVGEYVPATALQISPSSLVLHAKNNPIAKLSAEIEPANATDKQVTWKSENPLIATVDNNGTVRAVNSGTTTITATLGSLTAKAKVTVNGPSEPNTPESNTPGSDPEQDVKSDPSGSSTKKSHLEVVGNKVVIKGKINYENNKEGQKIAIIQLTKEQLKELLSNNQIKSHMELVVKSDANVAIQEFRISLHELQNLHKEMNLNEVVLQSQGATYGLPVADAIEEGAYLGQNTQVMIRIKKLSGEVEKKIGSYLGQLGSQSVSDVMEFNLSMVAGTKVQQLNHLSHYSTKTIKLEKVTDPKKLVGIFYEPETNRIHPVPTVIEYKDGQWVATIKHKSNGIYTVIQNNRYFTDLQSHWSQFDVELLANRLIVNGISESTFDPDGQVTRAQFAAMLVRALGIHTTGQKINFLDVNNSDWYADAIGAAVQSGIVAGYTDGNFQPNRPISRQELTVMLQRAAQFAGLSPLNQSLDYEQITKEFQDSKLTPTWAQDAMLEAIQRGWIRGRSNTQLVPQGAASRAEAVVMIKRLLKDLQFINE